MKNGHAPGKYVTVGSEFAKQLGYESNVGALGIIDNVMNAMCGVSILTGDAEFIGKQVDIHIQDCIVESTKPSENLYHVIINMRAGNIYYSTNKELMMYTTQCIGHSMKREVHNIKDMSSIWDMVETDSTMQQYQDSYKLNWMMFCLDDESCEKTKVYRDSYEADLADKQAKQEAFQEATDALKKAKQARMDEIKSGKVDKPSRELPLYIKPDLAPPTKEQSQAMSDTGIWVNPEDTIPSSLVVDSDNPKPLKSLVEELRKQIDSKQQDEILKRADEAIEKADESLKRLHEGEQMYSKGMEEAMGKSEEYEPTQEEKDGHYDPTDI